MTNFGRRDIDSPLRETKPEAARRLRVLVSTSTFPLSPDDGTPRFVLDLAEALADHAEIIVLAPDAPGAPRCERMGRLEVRRATYFVPRGLQRLALGRGMPENLRSSWLARIQVPFYLIRQWQAIHAMARQLKVDVVNAHWLVPQGLAAAWARGSKRRFKLLLHVHSTDVHLLRGLPGGRRIARFVVRRCDAVFATSSFVRSALDELLGFASGASLRSMGVHTQIFAQPSTPDSSSGRAPNQGDQLPGDFLLFVGRLAPVKGVDILIAAMPAVLAEHPELHLMVIGQGSEESNLRALSKDLGVDRRVSFLGRKPHPDIVRLLQNCRAAIVPSIVTPRGETEGMPTVVLEAMAAGARIVASDVGGIPDVVRHGENGWLCRSRDPSDLARKILTALADPVSSGVRPSAVETARQNDWQEVAKSYKDCLNKLADG